MSFFLVCSVGLCLFEFLEKRKEECEEVNVIITYRNDGENDSKIRPNLLEN